MQLVKRLFYVAAFVTVVTTQVGPKLATHLAYVGYDKSSVFVTDFLSVLS
jgi:hypothetical protein